MKIIKTAFKLLNSLGAIINPATEDKQDDIIENQTDGTQKTQIVDSLGTTWELEQNGAMPVNIQDQTTRAFDNRLCMTVTGTPYTLASDAEPNDYDIELVDATGLNVGDTIGLFQNSSNPASYFGVILSIASNTLTMDTPIDNLFDTDLSPVLFEVACNANADGSVSPVIFKMANDANQAIDITRILIHITDEIAMDDSKFGGLTALTRGVVLRKKKADGSYTNYWNRAVKTNGELGLVAFDKEYDPKAPAGVYGLRARYTMGGQSKHGVVIRLSINEELQLVVQDDLTGLLTFEIMAEGHFVTD